MGQNLTLMANKFYARIYLCQHHFDRVQLLDDLLALVPKLEIHIQIGFVSICPAPLLHIYVELCCLLGRLTLTNRLLPLKIGRVRLLEFANAPNLSILLFTTWWLLLLLLLLIRFLLLLSMLCQIQIQI